LIVDLHRFDAGQLFEINCKRLGNAVSRAIGNACAFEVNACNAIFYIGPVVTSEAVVYGGEALRFFTCAWAGKIKVEDGREQVGIGAYVAQDRQL
jgi:hypothetical protein